jgi:hypothetical protein
MPVVTRVAVTTEGPAVGAQLGDRSGCRTDRADEERGAADPERVELEHREHEGREQAARGDGQGDPPSVAVDLAIAFIAGRVEFFTPQPGADACDDRGDDRREHRAHEVDAERPQHGRLPAEPRDGGIRELRQHDGEVAGGRERGEHDRDPGGAFACRRKDAIVCVHASTVGATTPNVKNV